MNPTFHSPASGASNDQPVPETPPSPTEFQRLVGQAVQHAQLLAYVTDALLSAEDDIREKAAAAGEAIKEAGPVVHRALRWWTILQPPADPPAAAAYFHWVYRRAQGALAHAAVATEAGAPWKQAAAFARTHVPPIDLEWLQVRLLAETQTAKPTTVPNAVADPMLDYRISAMEHWCDAAEMQSEVEQNGEQPGRSAAKDGEELQTPPALTQKHFDILTVLQLEFPRTVLQNDIVTAAFFDRKSVGTYMSELRRWGYIERPRGPREGDRITKAGLALLKKKGASH